MSFLSFLFNSFRNKDRPKDRAELQVPCKFIIFAQNEEPKEKPTSSMKTGAVINMSPGGLGIITVPAFDSEYSEMIKKNKHHIYIEAHSLQSDTHQKMRGEIRWVKLVTDVSEPYSEMGISILSVEDETQSQFLDSLFEQPIDPPIDPRQGEK